MSPQNGSSLLKIATNFGRKLGWLVYPTYQVADISARRQAIFSAMMSLSLFLVVLTGFVANVFVYSLNHFITIVLAGLSIILFMAYVLSRLSVVRFLGSALLTFSLSASAFLVAILHPDRETLYISGAIFTFIPLALVMGSALLPWWGSFVLMAANFGAVMFLPLVIPTYPLERAGADAGAILSMGVLLLGVNSYRNNTERLRLEEIREINLRLHEANRDLEAKNAELEKTKRAVQESEQRFRAFVEQSTDGLLLTDEQGTVIEQNLAQQKLTGIRHEQVIGQPIWEMLLSMLPPERQSLTTRQRFQETVQTALRTGQGQFVNQTQEIEICRPDGTHAFCLQTTFLIETEMGYRFGSITHDITERKRAEQALYESEQKFRDFIEQSTEGFILVDENGRVVEWNQAQELISGITRETALSMNLWNIQFQMTVPEHRAPGTLERIQARMLEMLRSGYVPPHLQNVDAEICKQNGQRVLVQQSVFPIKTERGYYLGAIARDITRRKQTELEREELIRKLEAQNAELERFTYTVSHDLKAPLVTVRGFLGFVAKDAQVGNLERLKADMARITEATDKMQQLLTELLELSRIGRMMNPPQAVPFETIVREALELVRGRIEARGVQVRVAPDLPVVYGDRARLVEVVQNLVDNAAKFMGEQPSPCIEIGTRGTDADGKPILFVRDNGIGIEAQHHERVFGLFNKLNAQSEGTGVGLALVKRIVEVHRGKIWVESDGAGFGALFCFTLPTRAS